MRSRASRAFGIILLVYWLLASVVALVLTSAQPDQLGVFEAFIYHAVASEPGWALILGIAFWGARTESIRRFVADIGILMASNWITCFSAGILMGTIWGPYPGYLPFKPFIAQFYTSVVRQPTWMLPVGVGLVIAAAVYEGDWE